MAAIDPPDAEQEERSGLVAFGVFLLFGQIFGYGFWVASGVVEEKASRVVEVILSKVRPSELLAGKVLGLGALGLAQLVVLLGVGLGAAVAAGTVDPPPGLARAAAEVGLWFVLGYAFFACACACACACAVAGAVASRQEELQNSASPPSLVPFGSFAAVAATAALVPVAARAYSGGALRTRSSVRLAEAWRAGR